ASRWKPRPTRLGCRWFCSLDTPCVNGSKIVYCWSVFADLRCRRVLDTGETDMTQLVYKRKDHPDFAGGGGRMPLELDPSSLRLKEMPEAVDAIPAWSLRGIMVSAIYRSILIRPLCATVLPFYGTPITYRLSIFWC